MITSSFGDILRRIYKKTGGIDNKIPDPPRAYLQNEGMGDEVDY